MKNTHIKNKKNLIWIVGVIIIILVIILFAMNKTIKSNCEKAVSDYQKLAKTFEIQNIPISDGNSIVVDYIGRLKDGKVFDTSIESIAKACSIYQTGRDYSQGLAFQVGAGQMIAGFDAGVIGMKIGQTKTINIPYMQAYGTRDEKKLLKMAITDEFKNYKEGDDISVMTQNGPVQLKVYKITETEITFDTNHMLAGKDLIFDITVKGIK